MSRRDDWIDVFRAVGEAFFAVLSSEWAVLVEAWQKGTLRRMRWAVILFFAAACLFFMLTGLVVVAMVLTLARFTALEPWAATWVVAAAVLVAAGTLAAVAQIVFVRQTENPVVTARQRLGDHLEWWRERLLTEERALPEGDGHGEEKVESSRDTGEPAPTG